MSKIAVLMSTYNGEQFIEEQMKSLAGQRCEHEIHIYVRDDGSSDNTINIIKSWENRLNIVLVRGNNIGPARSFWRLLQDQKIKADYYAFCDQDDIWDADKLELAVGHLNDNVHLYTCNCRSIDAEGNIIESLREKKTPIIELENLFVSGFVQGCAMVFTDQLRQYICKKNITCITMHDVVLCMYAMTYGKIYWDQTPHFGYRFHDNNVIARRNHKGVMAGLDTIRRWIKNRKNSLTKVAGELMENTSLPEEKREFLFNMSRLKKSPGSKLYILRYKKIRGMDRNALRSFYIRVLLNLI